jgi:hypothetical protein
LDIRGFKPADPALMDCYMASLPAAITRFSLNDSCDHRKSHSRQRRDFTEFQPSVRQQVTAKKTPGSCRPVFQITGPQSVPHIVNGVMSARFPYMAPC